MLEDNAVGVCVGVLLLKMVEEVELELNVNQAWKEMEGRRYLI